MGLQLLQGLPPLPKYLRKRQKQPSVSLVPVQLNSSAGIDISLEDRWLILGMTGSGKTVFSKELIKQLIKLYPGVPVTIIDSKARGDFIEWSSGIVISDDPPAPIETGVQVWQPTIDDFDAYSDFFDKHLYDYEGPEVILVDEISSLSKNKSVDAPISFERILKQGRAAGKCLITCSQEYAGSIRQVKNQTTHVVRFLLNGEYDPSAANRLMRRPKTETWEPRQKYGFLYTRIDKLARVTEYPGYKSFF